MPPWSYGDVEAGFKKAALVLDETFITPNTSHQCLESRSCMAYWQNGKLHIHLSTQSTIQTVNSIARWLSLEPTDIVLISEVLRRRVRQQGDGLGQRHHPRTAGEEDRHARDDAPESRRRTLRWPRAARDARVA